MTPREALERLLCALPRCCSCERAIGVVVNRDRWWLCETCWISVPCSDETPVLDLREAIAVASAALR